MTITDYKSSDVRDPAKARQRARESLQLQIYAMGYEAMTGRLPDAVALHFLESGLVGEVPVDPTRLAKARDRIAAGGGRDAGTGLHAASRTISPARTARSATSARRASPADAGAGRARDRASTRLDAGRRRGPSFAAPPGDRREQDRRPHRRWHPRALDPTMGRDRRARGPRLDGHGSTRPDRQPRPASRPRRSSGCSSGSSSRPATRRWTRAPGSSGPLLIGLAVALTLIPLVWLTVFGRHRRIAYRGDWLRAIRAVGLGRDRRHGPRRPAAPGPARAAHRAVHHRPGRRRRGDPVRGTLTRAVGRATLGCRGQTIPPSQETACPS